MKKREKEKEIIRPYRYGYMYISLFKLKSKNCQAFMAMLTLS